MYTIDKLNCPSCNIPVKNKDNICNICGGLLDQSSIAEPLSGLYVVHTDNSFNTTLFLTKIFKFYSPGWVKKYIH